MRRTALWPRCIPRSVTDRPPVPPQELLHRRPRPLAAAGRIIAVGIASRARGAVEGDDLCGVLGPLVGRHRRRRQPVHAADALGDATAHRHLAANGDAMFANASAAQGAVVVGVHKAGSQHPAACVDSELRPCRRAGRHGAQVHHEVAVDERVAAVGLGRPVAGDDKRVGDQLAHGLTVSGPAWASDPAAGASRAARRAGSERRPDPDRCPLRVRERRWRDRGLRQRRPPAWRPAAAGRRRGRFR